MFGFGSKRRSDVHNMKEFAKFKVGMDNRGNDPMSPGARQQAINREMHSNRGLAASFNDINKRLEREGKDPISPVDFANPSTRKRAMASMTYAEKKKLNLLGNTKNRMF